MCVIEIRSKRQRLLLAFKLELLFNKTEEVKNVSMCDDIGTGFLIVSKQAGCNWPDCGKRFK
jgi:hypothetical protein